MIVVPPFILTYVSYYFLGLADKSFQDLPMTYTLPFRWMNISFASSLIRISNLRLPMNSKTPLGYLCVLLLEASESFSIVSVALSAICFLVGSCWMFISFANDMTNNLHLLNIGGKSEENHVKMKERLCNVVNFFSDVKELSDIGARGRKYISKWIILQPILFISFQTDQWFQWDLWICNVWHIFVDIFDHLHLFILIFGGISWVYNSEISRFASCVL